MPLPHSPDLQPETARLNILGTWETKGIDNEFWDVYPSYSIETQQLHLSHLETCTLTFVASPCCCLKIT